MVYFKAKSNRAVEMKLSEIEFLGLLDIESIECVKECKFQVPALCSWSNTED